MLRLFILGIALALSGCAVTLHGNQVSDGNSTATTTGGSMRGGTRVGNAYIGGAFGTPPAPNASGGQVTFSKGASGVLVLGLVIAGAVDMVGGWLQPAVPRPEPRTGNISETCSCYGWQPELTSASRSQ